MSNFPSLKISAEVEKADTLVLFPILGEKLLVSLSMMFAVSFSCEDFVTLS